MFSGLKISARLLILIAALMGSMLFVGAYGIQALMGEQQRGVQALERKKLMTEALNRARAAEVAFKIQVQEFKNILLRGHDANDHQKYLAAFGKAGELVDKNLADTQQHMVKLGVPTRSAEHARALHAEIVGAYREGLKQFDVQRLDSTQTVDRAVRGKDRPLEQGIEAVVTTLEEFSEAETARITAAASAQGRRVMLVMGALMAFVLVAGTAFGLWISRSITRPLQQAVRASRRVADGDLTVNLQSASRDEVGELLMAISQMAANLRELVGQVVAGAHGVADSSGQIAQGNLDLSQRTEEQASTLEETASQMEELTSTVTQNAENARLASQVAAGAAAVAKKGGHAVGEVVDTMNGISASSRRIADIIGVIDGIAFQTNILALNAAVEAARAGEQGRGFAVVAAEVRDLAQRSAGAAKEIKTLIGDSVGKVEAGARQVNDAGQTMQEIVDSVKKVSELIAEIAAASQEQSSGIEQVNTAVTQMDQVVQQNASLVEEATAATESMKSQAATLLQIVSRFQLGSARSEPAMPARAAEPGLAPSELTPQPIRFRPARAALGASQKPAASPNAEWQAF
jgi:methyl-accepting chemotaxis protein